jgi:hypothetical protein
MKYHLQNITALAIIVTLGTVGYIALSTGASLPLSVVSSRTTSDATVTASSLPTENGSSVDAFIDSEGVNIHSSYLTNSYGPTPYGTAAAVTNALSALHIHNVRDNPSISPSPTEVSNIAAWMGIGTKFDFGVGSADTTRAAGLVNEITSHGQAGSTIGVEGPNELDSSGDTNWVADDQAAQQALYAAVRGNASLNGAKVVAPSISGIHDGSKAAQNGINDAAALGNLTASLDVGNVHSYPTAGNTPDSTIASHLTPIASVSGAKPVWSTESGYNDCPSSTCSTSPGYVSPSDQATLDPRIFLANYQHGVAKSFIYELFDESANGQTNFQEYWGLTNYTTSGAISFKPSGQAIANMNSVLLGSSDQGAAQNSSLSYSVSGDAATQHVFLTRRSAGVDHYLVAVWENTLPGPQSSAVTLSFAQGMNVTKYTPVTTASAISSVSGVTSYHDTVGPAVTVYDLTVAPVVAPTCPSGQTGTPPNCVTPSTTTGGTTGATTSGGSTTNSSGPVKTVTAVSLGSASTPIKASSVTLAPQTSLPLKDITKVEYLVDGTLVATVTKSPFTYNLTKSEIKNGCHNVSTVVFATVGPTTKTNRQVCVALTSSTMSLKTWGIGLGSLLAAGLLAAEFAPFYPRRAHLVSRAVSWIWSKIHPTPTPPAPPMPPGPSSPDRSPYPILPVPGQVVQP